MSSDYEDKLESDYTFRAGSSLQLQLSRVARLREVRPPKYLSCAVGNERGWFSLKGGRGFSMYTSDRVSSNLHRRFPSCGAAGLCGVPRGIHSSLAIHMECDWASPRKRVLC